MHSVWCNSVLEVVTRQPVGGWASDWRPRGGKAHCSHGQSVAPVCVEFDPANWSTGPLGQLVPTVNWSPRSTGPHGQLVPQLTGPHSQLLVSANTVEFEAQVSV